MRGCSTILSLAAAPHAPPPPFFIVGLVESEVGHAWNRTEGFFLSNDKFSYEESKDSLSAANYQE